MKLPEASVAPGSDSWREQVALLLEVHLEGYLDRRDPPDQREAAQEARMVVRPWVRRNAVRRRVDVLRRRSSPGVCETGR